MAQPRSERRSFRSLRERREVETSSLHQKAAKALFEIAETAQGQDIRAWLDQVTRQLAPANADESAWRQHEALRTVATVMIDMMDTGATNADQKSSSPKGA